MGKMQQQHKALLLKCVMEKDVRPEAWKIEEKVTFDVHPIHPILLNETK